MSLPFAPLLMDMPVEKPAGGRVVRLLGPDDPDLPKTMKRAGPTRSAASPRSQSAFAAAIAAMEAAPNEENEMPKGQYERKPKAETLNDAAPAVKKRSSKPRMLAVVRVAKPRGNPSTGRFEVAVDLRAGAVTINAASGSLILAPDEVLALFAFMARR